MGVFDMVDRAAMLVDFVGQQLGSYLFKITHRTSPEHFTRERGASSLSFYNTGLIVLKMIKKAIKDELMDSFYQIDKALEIPSRQAFSRAREKISYLAFKDFFKKSCELVVGNTHPKLYRGYRLYAIDGTTFTVGNINEMSSYFGQSTAIDGLAMCRISAVVDVLDDAIADATVAGFCEGERVLAIAQVKKLKSVVDALFLFDRGYWSPELVTQIISNGQKFLMRLPSNNNKSSVVVGGERIALRRLIFTLPCGEPEILITNIPKEEMSDNEIFALYAKRWGVETKYLELKARLQIDKFSQQSVNAVLQDIYATMYISNLVAFIADSTNDIIQAKTSGKGNKYEQKPNKSTCIAALRKRFIDICLADSPAKRQTQLVRFYHDLSKSVIYKGKSKPRPRDNRKIKSSRGHYNRPLL